MTDWLRRLTPEEYQLRRSLLRRATDPKCELGAKLLWPFKDELPLKWRWKGVAREGALCESPIDISRLEAVPFHKEGEYWVGGEEMLRRASDEEAFPGCQGWGQHQAENILEQANKLPEEFRQYAFVFCDTILLGEQDYLSVPFLVWSESKWQLNWSCIDSDFNRYHRFLRLRKPA